MNDLLLDGPPKVDGLMKRIGPFWGEEDGLLTKNWSILNKDKDSIYFETDSDPNLTLTPILIINKFINYQLKDSEDRIL